MTKIFDKGDDFFVNYGKVSEQTPALDALYGDRFYNMPQYNPWKLWFACRPVEVRTWQETDGLLYKKSEWAWLRTVSARTVTHGNKYLPGSQGIGYSREYVETFDILKFMGIKLSDL